MQRQSICRFLIGGLVCLFFLAVGGGSLFFSSQAHAAVQATYYVSPTGSDSNTDTSLSAPFATLDHAHQVVDLYLQGWQRNVKAASGGRSLHLATVGSAPVLKGNDQNEDALCIWSHRSCYSVWEWASSCGVFPQTVRKFHDR